MKSNLLLQHARRAFSLIEMIVVIGIVAVVFTFVVPAVTGMMRGSQLTSASQTLQDSLSFARQRAITLAKPVEVRIYKFADPETPGESISNEATWRYRAFQLFEQDAAGNFLPISKVNRLPSSVVFSEETWQGNELSSMLTSLRTLPGGFGQSFFTAKPDAQRDPIIPGQTQSSAIDHNYSYMSFIYGPSGATNLPVNTMVNGSLQQAIWFLTMTELTASASRDNINNFYTMQLDALTGITRAYTPTVR